MTKESTPDFNIAITGSFEIEVQTLLDLVVRNLEDSKIEDVKSFHLTHRSDLASYVLVGTGNSARHIVATAEKISDKIKSEYPYEITINIEGTSKNPQWILIDLQDIMIHLFIQEAREKYNLDAIYDQNHNS